MRYSSWDRAKDWVLLAGCLIVSLVVLFTRNTPVVRGVRSAALQVTSGVEARLAGVGQYLRALDENERLRSESVELAVEAARARAAVSENDHLRAMLAFRDTLQTPMVAVRIIGRDLGGEFNYFTVDAGRDEGVQEGMAVIDERGVLGRIILTSAHYARVMPYLNTDFRITARILPIGAEGIVRWDGQRQDRLVMDYVSRTEPVARGMVVVTSGASEVFPEGFPVGYVEERAAREGRNALDLKLRPAAPLDKTTHAFVLLTLPDSARVNLEGKALR